MTRVLASLLLAHLLAAPCLAEPLRAGFAKEDITPSEPVQLGGYDLRTGLSEGVYEGDKLFVRALAFDDGTRRVLFVESDVIGAHAAEAFPQRIAAATGVPRDHILFGDAHNHATPMPNPDGRTKFDKRYAEAIIAAAKGAIAALQPVRIAAGEGRSRVAMNRRQVRPVRQLFADHLRREQRQPELRRRQDQPPGADQGVRRSGAAGGEPGRSHRRRRAIGAD